MQRVSPSVAALPTQQRPRLGRTEFGLLAAKLYYFVFFASLGPLVSFFNIYLESQGLTGAQIGWISSLAPLITLISNPFWSSVADRWQIHRQVLMLCTILTGVVTILFVSAQTFWTLMALVLMLFFVRTPIPTLIDASVMDMMRRTGGSYGRQRVWGSIGFMLAAYLFGRLIAGEDLRLIFWLHAGLIGIGCTLLGLLLPIERSTDRVNLLAGLKQMVGQPGYLSFLLAILLAGAGLAGYVNFLSMQLRALGGSEAQIGLAWAINVVLEIPVMYMGTRWFARYRYGKLILIGFIGFIITFAGMALAATPLQFLWVLPLNGISYGIFWVAVVGYAAEAAPPGLTATSQGLVGAVQGGIGWGIGALLAGYLWDGMGGSAVFTMAAVAVAAATLVFWWGNRRRI
jgi:MFS transporter, PPP family, 3-phenylpropionic acid transporter